MPVTISAAVCRAHGQPLTIESVTLAAPAVDPLRAAGTIGRGAHTQADAAGLIGYLHSCTNFQCVAAHAFQHACFALGNS